MATENGLERLWKKIKNISATQRLIEEKLYEQVTTELLNGQRREGLWAKAFANSDGCEHRAKSLYINYRVQSIRDEAELAQAAAEEMANERKRKKEDLKKASQKNADGVREDTRLDVIEALLRASGYKLKSNRRKG